MEAVLYPDMWILAKLEDVTEILDSSRIPINNKERHARISGKPDSELFPYYGATGEVGKIDDYLFDEELVALGEDGVPFLDPRKPKAYLLEGKTWVNNHAHVLKGHPNGLSNKVLLHYLNQFDYQGYVNGGTRLKLTQANMRRIPFHLPPLAEQKVIAEKLDTLLAQVDTTKARLERIPDIIKRFRQSVLAAAVSGRLTEYFLANDDVKYDIAEEWISYQEAIFKESGKLPKSENWKKKAPSPEKRIEFLDDLLNKKGWSCYFLDEIILSKNQGVNTTTEKVEYTSSGIMAIQAGNVMSGSISFEAEKFIPEEKFKFLSCNVKPKEKDLLYTNIGASFGNAAVVPALSAQFVITWNVMRIVPSSITISKYLEIVLNSKIIRDEAHKAVSTSTVPFVNGKVIGKYIIPVPPKSEQTEIVRRVEELFAFADTIEQKAAAALERVNNLTQSILAKAFRGELTADWRAANPELISGDNSAEALLAKIQAEREALKPVKKTRKKKAEA